MKMKIRNMLTFAIAIGMLTSCARSPMGSSSPADLFRDEEAKTLEMPQAAKIETASEESEPSSPSIPSERIVIQTASLSIIVENPTEAVDKISQMAESMGGFVVTSNIYKSTNSRGEEFPAANITIRVPAEKLNEALQQIKALVSDADIDIKNEEISGQDVTSEVTDLESRLRNLRAAEKQLLEIMENATDSEDVIAVFRELTNVREEIELLEGQLKYYRESARLSAISVYLQAKASIEPITIGGWQPGVEVQRAIQALVEGGKFIVNALIWLVLFVFPLLAVIGLPIYFIVKAVRKHQLKKSEKETK